MVAVLDGVPDVRERGAAKPSRFVIISGYHDYRSKRRANLHFIADELAKRGSVLFLSIRYSHLTRLTEDPRHDLWDRANRLENIDGVDCYLWRTPIHAFRLPRGLAWVERALFGLFADRLPAPAQDTIAAADMVFIESGIALIHVPLLRRLAPSAQIVYLASDSLDAINQAGTIKSAFERHAHLIDSARLPSPYLRSDVPACIPCYFIPHGIEKDRFARIGSTPYRPGSLNAVSVGSMLFDPEFFRIAGALFPAVTFNVIGSGHSGPNTSNVIYFPEMSFESTLPYIKHANFAIAPYNNKVVPYLQHTSMKLMQYQFLGVPAVCPQVVAGRNSGRFGYTPGLTRSIQESIEKALDRASLRTSDFLDWGDVVERLTCPMRFKNTLLVD